MPNKYRLVLHCLYYGGELWWYVTIGGYSTWAYTHCGAAMQHATSLAKALATQGVYSAVVFKP